ncbi:hypothetical protein DYQ05_01920 [Treponema pedis]|nr:hypothetical protein DYQ05_01920 [Treponema pedis]
MYNISIFCTSVSVKKTLNETTQRFGKGIIIVNDNGSENMYKARQQLSSERIVQYWYRPYKPKDKSLL